MRAAIERGMGRIVAALVMQVVLQRRLLHELRSLRADKVRPA